MSNNKPLSTSIALAILAPALVLASPALGRETRSGTSLPRAGLSGEDHGAGRSQPRQVGPKKGWPDNHGIENAWERANEHSAHHRNESEG